MINDATLWWILAGTLVLAELLTGSFYLLMLALGAVVGAVSAYADFTPAAQWLTAAVCSSAFVFACYLLRRRLGGKRAAADPNLHLDIGESVMVDAWDADGSATVRYRGALWTVTLRHGQEPSPGPHRVAEVVGNRLILEKSKFCKET